MRTAHIILSGAGKTELVAAGTFTDMKIKFASLNPARNETVELWSSDFRPKFKSSNGDVRSKKIVPNAEVKTEAKAKDK